MFKRILGVSLATVMALTSTVSALALTPADGLLTATGDYANSTGSVIADKDAVDINGVVGKDTTQGKYSQYDVVVDGYTGTTMDDTTSETEVYATVLPMFMTRIPKVLVLSAAGECEFAVSVKGDISGAQTVLIKPEAEQFDMVEVDPLTGNPIGKKDNVPATISVDDIDWTYATDFKTVDSATYVDHTGSILADGLTAGSWRGTFNFLIGLDVLGNGSIPAPDAPEGDETTNYTVEEIEADETLIMLGATRPEYVVADFNDDFTEVIITKNGEDSDGVMAALVDFDTEDFLSPMVAHMDTLEKATVAEGVTNVGVGAFIMCENLNDVTLPNSLTSIDMLSFAMCSNLTSIEIPESVEVIADGAFMQTGLEEVVIPDNVTEIGASAFSECANLVTADIGNSVETIGDQAFFSCSNLTAVNLPESLQYIGEEAFMSTSSLLEITLPADITYMGEDVFGVPSMEGTDKTIYVPADSATAEAIEQVPYGHLYNVVYM